MYFKRLEMHGFKSFAEPAVIEFHEGVTRSEERRVGKECGS